MGAPSYLHFQLDLNGLNTTGLHLPSGSLLPDPYIDGLRVNCTRWHFAKATLKGYPGCQNLNPCGPDQTSLCDELGVRQGWCVHS